MTRARACFLSWAGLCAVCIAVLSVPSACRFTSPTGAAADPADMLPLDNDISGFLKKGSTSVMTDQQTIFNAIDGEAQRYIDYGFMEGVNQLYSNSAVDIDVQIFNQGNATNAQDLYTYFASSISPQPLNAPGAEAVIDNSLPTGYQILYTRQNIFMRVTTTEKSDFALNMAKQFYRNIDNKISIQ
jgi:hypothetical protein